MWNFGSCNFTEKDELKWEKTVGKLYEVCSEYNEYISQPEKYKNANFYLIRNKASKSLGKFVDIYGHRGILVGAVIDDDDYYYLVMDDTRKITYHSCCVGFKEITEEELSMNYSVLLWLRDNEPDSLLQIVEKCIENNYVIPITDISVV
jgi:hypothetical protein